MIVVVRLNGLRLESVNRPQVGMSKGATFAQAAKIKRVRVRVELEVRAALSHIRQLPAAIHVIRISAGRCDDDNLIGSSKALLDGIASALGVNDRTFVILGCRPGIRVTFDQRSEGRGQFAAELRFTFTDGAP